MELESKGNQLQLNPSFISTMIRQTIYFSSQALAYFDSSVV